MKALFPTVLLLCAGFAAAADEDATFRAHLVGTQEVPAIFAGGSALFEGRVLDDDAGIQFRLDYEQLTAPPLVAHVHFAQRGVSGGVSFFLCGGGGKPPCPASTSGSVTGTVAAANVVGPASQGIGPGDLGAILQMIRAGLGYVNVHTPLHPGGEIRGQIRAVGEHDRD